MNATTTATKIHQPNRPCHFAVGDLVTCPGPFNSGQDDRGYWRRVETVSAVQWDGRVKPRLRGRGFLPFGWRVAVSGYLSEDIDFAPAPAGAKAGDIVYISEG
jgi:hypothetical protein